jgi:hypothetical protein
MKYEEVYFRRIFNSKCVSFINLANNEIHRSTQGVVSLINLLKASGNFTYHQC